MYYDYHMHSSFSHDSNTPMDFMIKRSVELFLKEICFTEHVDYGVIVDGKEIDINIDYNDYFSKLSYFKNLYEDSITIKKGIEMGLQQHILDKCVKDINNNEFDFVIASIHSINKYELIKGEFYKNKTQTEAYRQYYETLYDIIKKFKSYSILGHLDIIKRYGDLDNIVDDKIFSDIIDEILKIVIYEGKGIEVNTSCFRYKLPDLTPSKYILKRYKDLGGEIITTGSDSHNPSQIACKFKMIYQNLKDMGYKYICTFDKMKPNFIKI